MKPRLTQISVVTLVVVALVAGGLLVRPADVQAAPSSPKVTASTPDDSPISVEVVSTEDERAVLRVRNRTPFMVIVYVGGVRIGWMRPYRVGLIRGLRAGHHRLYAHTRFGSTSWGPRFIWVPGTWNLLY